MSDTAEHDEHEVLILDTVDRFLERDVKPYAMELEHNDTAQKSSSPAPVRIATWVSVDFRNSRK